MRYKRTCSNSAGKNMWHFLRKRCIRYIEHASLVAVGIISHYCTTYTSDVYIYVGIYIHFSSLSTTYTNASTLHFQRASRVVASQTQHAIRDSAEWCSQSVMQAENAR